MGTEIVSRRTTLFTVGSGLLLLLVLTGCSLSLPPLGISGKYRVARDNLIKPRGMGVAKAIPLLEEVAAKDPTYEDSLTLLGRSYYAQGRYREALQITQRALVVNKDDGIAWLVLGMAQLRLGDNQKGLQSFKGGLAILNKVAVNGYQGYYTYDKNGLVRAAIRRAIFNVNKTGLENKDSLIRSGELILSRMDDEELFQRGDKMVKEQTEHLE